MSLLIVRIVLLCPQCFAFLFGQYPIFGILSSETSISLLGEQFAYCPSNTIGPPDIYFSTCSPALLDTSPRHISSTHLLLLAFNLTFVFLILSSLTNMTTNNLETVVQTVGAVRRRSESPPPTVHAHKRRRLTRSAPPRLCETPHASDEAKERYTCSPLMLWTNHLCNTLYRTLASPPTTRAGGFRFAELPQTVRHRIYRLLLVAPGTIWVKQNQAARTWYSPKCLLPGIRYAVLVARGGRRHFHEVPYINVGILRASRAVHAEARGFLYGENTFGVQSLTSTTRPRADYAVPLFEQPSARAIEHLSMRFGTLDEAAWLLAVGHREVRRAYPGLVRLEVVFFMERLQKVQSRKRLRLMRCARGESRAGWVHRLARYFRHRVHAAGVRAPFPEWIAGRVVMASGGGASPVELEQIKAALEEAFDCLRTMLEPKRSTRAGTRAAAAEARHRRTAGSS